MIECIFDFLSDIPIEATFSMLGVIAGALISISGIKMANKSNKEQLIIQLDHDKKFRSIEKYNNSLEELYILIENWSKGLFVNFMNYSMFMKGNINYESFLKLSIENKNYNIDSTRQEMIIDLYVPELSSMYKQIKSNRDELNEIETDFKKQLDNGECNRSEYIKRSLEKWLVIEQEIEELKKSISSNVKKY